MRMAVNMEKLNVFVEQFVGDLGAAVHAGMVVIGENLGLYKALAEGPFNSTELAAKTKTDERYMREWLASQAAAPLKGQQQHPAVFATWFSRCHRLLYFLACRVLGAPERSDDAIENCWLTASRSPPLFECEGAFRSWVLRILIDEALAIRGHSQEIQEPIACQQDAGSKNS